MCPKSSLNLDWQRKNTVFDQITRTGDKNLEMRSCRGLVEAKFEIVEALNGQNVVHQIGIMRKIHFFSQTISLYLYTFYRNIKKRCYLF